MPPSLESFTLTFWRTGAREKDMNPLGYLSKLFSSFIQLSVAASLRRKTPVTAF